MAALMMNSRILSMCLLSLLYTEIWAADPSTVPWYGASIRVRTRDNQAENLR
jgi:hypothetical protein